MRFYHYFAMLMLVLLGVSAKAQYAFFPQEGTIEYDKTVHVKNLLQRYIGTLKDDDFTKKYYSEILEKVEEKTVFKKKLSFRGDEMSLESVDSTYSPLVNNLLNGGLLDSRSAIYQDLKKDQVISKFDISGSTVLIQDSLLDVRWKITDEYREIAGYQCRRANGVVLDSVYVVAFYTDQIPISVGPGTIHGLPGMIMGLVIPEQHYNIYASKVSVAAPEIKAVTGKKKDKPMTRIEVRQTFKDLLGRWMNDRQFNLFIAPMFL